MFTKAKESRGNHWRTSICSFETRITFVWVVNWEGSLLKVKLGSWRKQNGLVALEMNTEKFSRRASVTWCCHYGLASAVYYVLIFFFLLLVRSDRYDWYSCKKPYKWPSLTALKRESVISILCSHRRVSNLMNVINEFYWSILQQPSTWVEVNFEKIQSPES